MREDNPLVPDSSKRAPYTKPELSGTCEITTPRLDLRRFKERDAQEAYEWSRDALIKAYSQGSVYNTVDEARDAICSWRAQYGSDGFLLWCVQEAESRKAIGKISARVDVSCSSAEVEYSISSNRRGKGYAPEALSAVMGYLHGIGVHRVFARIDVENISSIRVAEKAGMALEGICADALVDRYGKLYDIALFAHVEGRSEA